MVELEPFSNPQVTSLISCESDEDLLTTIASIRESEGWTDLKRGELYPELLRATVTLVKVGSKAYQVSPSQIMASYGSNGSIDTIFSASLVHFGPNPTLMVPSPTYFRVYQSAEARSISMKRVSLDREYEVDTPALIDGITSSKPSPVYLASTNNSTGLPIRDVELTAILDAIPGVQWVILDRTLANTADEISTKDLLHHYKPLNLVILHSLSKYERAAHLRIGLMLFSNPAFAKKIEPFLPLGIGPAGCLRAIRPLMRHNEQKPDANVCSAIRANTEFLRGESISSRA